MVSKILQEEILFKPCFQLFKRSELGQLEKNSKSVLVKKKEKQTRQLKTVLFAMLKTLESFLYWTHFYSTMDQQLAKCNKAYVTAIYNKRQVCVTIKKHNVNKPPYIPIRLFTAKGNEAKKQVAMSIILWLKSNNCCKIWETSYLLRTVVYNELCYLCFLSCNLNIYFQNRCSFSFCVEQYELEYCVFKKLSLKFHDKLGLFHIALQKSPKFFC